MEQYFNVLMFLKLGCYIGLASITYSIVSGSYSYTLERLMVYIIKRRVANARSRGSNGFGPTSGNA